MKISKANLLPAAGFIFLLSFACLLGPTEPHCKGAPLSTFLEPDKYSKTMAGDFFALVPGTVSDEKMEAVRDMGTRIIPFLLSLIEAKDSKVRLFWNGLVGEESMFRLKYFTARKRRLLGVRGFLALGTNAARASHELLLRFDSKDAPIRYAALICLCECCTDRGILDEAVKRACNDPEPMIQFVARYKAYHLSLTQECPLDFIKSAVPPYQERQYNSGQHGEIETPK